MGLEYSRCPDCEQACTPDLIMAVSKRAIDTYRSSQGVLDQYLRYYHDNDHEHAPLPVTPMRMPRYNPHVTTPQHQLQPVPVPQR